MGADRTDRRHWRSVRRSGIGSSDVSAILGMSKWACARDIWADKTGLTSLDDDDTNEAAEWGIELEPVVRRVWTRRTGIEVSLIGMHRSLEHPFMLYDADGLTSDGGLYEGKTASLWKRDEWGEDQVPDHAELQVQHGMAVMGLGHAWVAGLIGGQKLVWQRIERDDELISMIIKAEREFWHNHVLTDVEPPLDGSEASRKYVVERYPLAEPEKTVQVDPETAAVIRAAYAQGSKASKDSKADAEHAKNLVRDLMGEAEVAMCGEKVVATWTNNGSEFDSAAFCTAHPELATEFTTTVEVIDKAALAKAHPDIYRKYRNRVLRIKAK